MSTSEVEVAWNIEDIRRSLNFISDHAAEAGGTAASVTARIFSRTRDDEIRRACLDSLSRINNSKARTELLKISQNQSIDSTWRELADSHLRRGSDQTQPIASTVNGSAPKVGQP